MKTVPLGEVADVNPKAPRIPDDVEVSFVGMADLNAVSAETQSVSVRPYAEVRKGYTTFRNGDVLVAKITPCFENNKIGQARLQRDIGVGSTEFHVVRPGEHLDTRYVLHLLRQDCIRHQGELRMTGSAGQRRVPADFLKQLKIPLPPLDEQRRIAAILDQADALQARSASTHSLVDELERSVFLEMFGDPMRNPRGWPLIPIDEICNLVRGSSPRPQGDPRFFGGPVPRLMISDITRDGKLVTPRTDSLTLEGAKRSRPCSAGTVVMAVSGNIGLTSILAVDACIHDGFVGFTQLDEDQVHPRFLLEVLRQSKAAHDQSQAGAIFKNITTKDIKKMRIIKPHLDLQAEFRHRVGGIEKFGEQLRTSEASIAALRSSLVDGAFRGELVAHV